MSFIAKEKVFFWSRCYTVASFVTYSLKHLSLSVSGPCTLQRWVWALLGAHFVVLYSSIWVYLMFFMSKCRLYIFGKNASEEMLNSFQNSVSGEMCWVVPLMAMLTSNTWLWWCQPGFSTVRFFFFFFSFVINKYHIGRVVWESIKLFLL